MATYRLHQRMGYRVMRLARILQARLEEELAPHGLTRLMWLVLYGIGTDGVVKPSELASYLGITRPSVSRLLHRMEARGLISRVEPTEGDGRQVRLSLTAEGARVMGEVMPRIDAHNARFCGKLTPEELSALMGSLDRLADGEAEVVAPA